MSYKEALHPHQSESLKFLSADYIPFKNEGGVKIFGVIKFERDKWQVVYQNNLPKIGGYISQKESYFGNPVYCPNATRHHKKHKELYGSMPHLVFFNSEETAKKAGFRRCKTCSKTSKKKIRS